MASNGFQVPTIPKGPRSSRMRGPNEKKAEDSQLCAFELLASLAGKLLQESESSSASSNASEGNNHPAFSKDAIKKERRDGHGLVKEECFEQGSSEESAFASEISSPDIDQKFIKKKFPNAVSECTSNKSFMYKVGDDVKSVMCDSRLAFHNYPSKVEGGCLLTGESDANVEDGIGPKNGEVLESAGLTMANACSSNDPMDLQVEFPTMVNSENDVKLSLREAVPNASFSVHRSDIKLVGRDDDENFSRRNKSSINLKALRPPMHVGDRRIRKLPTSKYWKTAPKLRDCEVFRSDCGRKTLYNKRKHGYHHDRYQHDTLYKRRKLFDRSILVSSDGGFSSESVTNSPEKGKKCNTSGSNRTLHGATGVSSSVIRRQSSFHSKDSHVKFSIKSFKIPELYIEVPETTTVGSLKRTVMDAVATILGGGLRVGVLLEGEKIRDDNVTLLQTGLSCKDNLDTLGFTLEPSSMQVSQSICSDGPHSSLPYDIPEPLTRSPGTPVLDSGISNALPELPLPVTTNSATNIDNNEESVSSLTDSITDKTTPDSRALVVVPPMSVEALAVVPATPKNRKSSELVQRRTRRPFSVSEVEALVQAVEDLGTGRWRDVKLRAFEDADHRTYVDLKDKWKTLVHTATISPQQRRGEPVPQELLDRVLAAHSYWSQHQAKQHVKPQAGTTATKIGDAPADNHGVEGIGSPSVLHDVKNRKIMFDTNRGNKKNCTNHETV